MKYIAGTREELEAMRSAIEASLGYPRMPDVVGVNVRDPQPTVHAYGIIDDAPSSALMTVEASLEAVVSDERIGADVRKALAAKLKAKVEKSDTDAVQPENTEKG